MQLLALLREDLLCWEKVAEGVIFSDGSVVIRWLLYPFSLAIYRALEELRQDLQDGCIHIVVKECQDDDDGQSDSRYYLASFQSREWEQGRNQEECGGISSSVQGNA